MKKEKLPLMLTEENCDDLWSALIVWQISLDKKENPVTAKAIEVLIKKVRAHIKKFK